jgi:hypothetical protein
MKMHLPDSRGIPTGPIECPGDRWGITADPAEVVGDICHLRILTEDKGCSGWLANRRNGAALIEDHTFAGHAIQRRGLHKIQTVTGQGVLSLLIGSDEEDILYFAHQLSISGWNAQKGFAGPQGPE